MATDNYKGGTMAARRLAEVLGGKGNVILLRYNRRQREHGAARSRVSGDAARNIQNQGLSPKPILGDHARSTLDKAQNC